MASFLIGRKVLLAIGIINYVMYFLNSNSELIVKYYVGLQILLDQGISEPVLIAVVIDGPLWAKS